MAKKSVKPVMEFEFLGADLQRLLASNPKKVLFTVWVQVVKDEKGKKVGALRIQASNESVRRGARDRGPVNGEPKPPGM